MNTLLLELRLNPLEGMSRSEIVERAIIWRARRRGISNCPLSETESHIRLNGPEVDPTIGEFADAPRAHEASTIVLVWTAMDFDHS
jgi:hypothetical protein